MTPDELGKIVRQAWVAYCKETGWRTAYETVCDWEEMTDENAKEVDRRIGVAVARAAEAAAFRRGAEETVKWCAVAVCDYCRHDASEYGAAELDDGEWFHQDMRHVGNWTRCSAGAIWQAWADRNSPLPEPGDGAK